MKIRLKMNSVKHLSIISLFVFLAACSANDLGTVPDLGAGPGSELGADMRLSWAAPTERESNTQLLSSEIDIYRVYYGNNSGFYEYQIDNSNVTYDGADITGFQKGAYYFVVTTVDTEGRESKYSDEIMVEI